MKSCHFFVENQVKLSKQQAKYAKETKSQMKQELKHVKAELDAEVKKTPYLRKNSDRQHWQNLERKIKERFPEDTARSVLSELASSFMSGQGT